MDVRVEDVAFRRDGREVLSISSLSIHAGQATAVLGSNGAGKTTLLRLIAGLDRPRAGRVLVGGEAADARRGYASYVFQEDVFLRRSVLDNLVLALQIRGVRRREAHERALLALRLVGIEPLAGRRADRISGGEGRRASLARALSLHAPVLLLDEPTAGLDGSTYTHLLDELPRLLRGSGATTIVVTHDPEEAFRLCENVVILVDGHVRASGPKHDIASNPRHADVAAILGYIVLNLAGRAVAIPPSSLAIDAGPTSLSATVESVFDVVDRWDVSVLVGETRLHIPLPRSASPPQSGDQVGILPKVTYPLS